LTGAAEAQARVGRLATMLPVHRAFYWLHLHQPQLKAWQMELSGIPAPPFAEGERAAWFVEQFAALGLENVHLDEVGNALGKLGGGGPEAQYVLVSAHLDTVFPAGTACAPVEREGRLLGPGICDNAAGLTGLLALAAALRFAGIVPPVPVLFAANVGEEGEGDLRGMRHLFETGCYRGRITAALALEGSGTGGVVTRALGSRRFRLTAAGPGGHSWSDAGLANPIVTLARAIAALAELELPERPRTTLNVGMVSGGTSVNSIPETASALVDVRSADSDVLAATEARVRAVCAGMGVGMETIGERPAAALAEDAALLQTIRAVDRHLGLRTEAGIGSTDANLPLSLGVPAVAIGAGGTGGGMHTLQEWYDPAGRETALRRVLLTLLDVAGT
jgi:acetylornithine deacetylase/succinyl-diaminopimelate desuccinylase-like protein